MARLNAGLTSPLAARLGQEEQKTFPCWAAAPAADLSVPSSTSVPLLLGSGAACFISPDIRCRRAGFPGGSQLNHPTKPACSSQALLLCCCFSLPLCHLQAGAGAGGTERGLFGGPQGAGDEVLSSQATSPRSMPAKRRPKKKKKKKLQSFQSGLVSPGVS